MKKNILLVEYCSATIDSIKEMLHHDVFEITIAKTEEVAKELINRLKFDLMITETLLPKSHGFILSSFVKKKSPDTRIIIISEKLKAIDCKHEAIDKHGADDFFEKPLKEKTFSKRVLQLLDITEDDLEDYEGMSTNIHVIPLLEDIRKFPKSSEKDVFGKIIEDVRNNPTYEIDLD